MPHAELSTSDDTIRSRAQLEELYQLMDIDPDNIEDDWYVMNRMRDICKEKAYLLKRAQLLQRDIEKLTRYLDQLQHDVTAIEHSRSWKLGLMIVSTLKLVLGRNAGRNVFATVHRTFGFYHHWKKSRD